MFVNFAIYGFVLQIILIAGVFLISKSLPTEKNDKELLEKLYKQSSFSEGYLRNLKLK